MNDSIINDSNISYMENEKQYRESKKKPSIAKSTVSMSLATILSRGSGFARSIALAYVLGDTVLNDLYNTANYMPNIIFEMVMGGVLASVVVPVYVQYISNENKDESRYMINNLMNIIFFVAIIASVLSAIFAPSLIKLMTIREPLRNNVIMLLFFRIFAFEIMFYGISAVFNGVLNSHRFFTIPMLAPVVNNIVVIFFAVGVYLPLYKSDHELALQLLAIGTLLGVLAMVLFQMPTARRAGLRFQRSLDFKHPSIKKVVNLGLPLLANVAILQANNFIVYMLLQTTKCGATAYSNAMLFFLLPHAICSATLTTAIFPELSRYACLKDYENFKRILAIGLRTTLFVIIPSSVFLMIMAKPIIELTFQHGAFGTSGTQITALLVQAFAIALPAYSVNDLITRVYYSMQDTVTPMKIGVFSILVQITLNFFLIDRFGPTGLVLSYAFAQTFSSVSKLYLLRKRIGQFGMIKTTHAMIKHVMAAVLTGITISLFSDYVMTKQVLQPVLNFIRVAGSVVITLAAYFGFAALLRVEEVSYFRNVILRLRMRSNVSKTT
jgi:putative peptidoglycan lipid II flippase